MFSMTCSFLNQIYTLSQLKNLSLSNERVDEVWHQLSFYLEDNFHSHLNYPLAELSLTSGGLIKTTSYRIRCQPLSSSDSSWTFVLQMFKQDRLFYQLNQTFTCSTQGLADALSLLKEILEIELTLFSEQLSSDSIDEGFAYQHLLMERPHQSALIMELFLTRCTDEILKNQKLSPASLNWIQSLSTMKF